MLSQSYFPPRGRRTSVTDGNGKTTTYAYDDADRLTSVTDAASNVTRYAYDNESHLTSITDAANHTTSFTYNNNGWLSKTTFPSTLYETYTYDYIGNLQTKVNRKGQSSYYSYDDFDRLSYKTIGYYVFYTYDKAGRLTQVQDNTGSNASYYTFAYDRIGRLTQTTTKYSFLSGHTYTVSYAYDAAGNRTSMTDPANGVTNYSYDSLNHLTGLTDFNSNSFGFTYDALSRRTQLTRPNGVSTNYAYDNLSRLLSVLHQVGLTTIDGATYTYDNAGNRTSKVNQLNGGTENYTYDQIYQLTQVVQGLNTTEAYTYDAVGNRLSTVSDSGWTYDSSNHLTTRPGVTYTYDNNGNTATKVDVSGTTTYAWNYDNQLTSVTLPGSGGTVTFKYDPFGRRIQKVSSAGTTNYLYDGANAVEEVDGTGAILARYAHGVGIDEPLDSVTGSGTRYYGADALGSVTSLADISGSLTDSYVNDSFGKTVTSSGTTRNPFRFTARDLDAETGLMYYRARYYDGSVGRFLTEDPIGFRGGPNLYEYVHNRPTGDIDPWGLFTVDDAIRQHPTIAISQTCPAGTAGACTIIRRIFLTCTCECSGQGWKATASLHIEGDLYVYNGPFSLLRPRPRDRSVVDATSAIAHEYNVHINPAITAVTPMINGLESRAFGSETECRNECSAVSRRVDALFRQTLRTTMQQEIRGR